MKTDRPNTKITLATLCAILALVLPAIAWLIMLAYGIRSDINARVSISDLEAVQDEEAKYYPDIAKVNSRRVIAESRQERAGSEERGIFP